MLGLYFLLNPRDTIRQDAITSHLPFTASCWGRGMIKEEVLYWGTLVCAAPLRFCQTGPSHLICKT